MTYYAAPSAAAMGHLQDGWEVVRSGTLPWLHAALSVVGAYAEGDVAPSSYALTAEIGVEELEHRLHHAGFVRNPVASFKRRGDGHESGSWVWRRSLLADEQLHVLLFPGPTADETDVYAHRERSWITHPVSHYRQAGVDPAAGVRRVRERFREAGIPFEVREVGEGSETARGREAGEGETA